jgi:ADP-ribose pyrophosphatase YjhB (NUDIX family)
MNHESDLPAGRPEHPMPFTRLELAAFAVDGGQLQVLLGQRAEAPHKGRWALPGGVLRIDKDADLDAACQRVALERLGVALPQPCQVAAVGGRRRDPRAPWALSIVYRAMVRPDALGAVAGKRLAELSWRSIDEAVSTPLAFDHAAVVQRAVEQLRGEVATLQFPPGLVEAQFTLGELQAASEAVLGHPLDKSSFRRRLEAAGAVEPVEGVMRLGANRPAQVFRLVPRAFCAASNQD